MRKISLFAGIIAVTLGMGAVATASTAFADTLCLNPDAGTLDLSHTAMQPGAGWGYNKDSYDATMAQGNRCAPTTQQSAPVSQTDYVKGKTHTQTSYN